MRTHGTLLGEYALWAQVYVSAKMNVARNASVFNE